MKTFWLCASLIVSATASAKDTPAEFQVRASAQSVVVSLVGTPGSNHYRVYRGLSPHFKPDAKSLIDDGAPTDRVVCTDPGANLQAGTEYYYKVEELASDGSVIGLVPQGLNPVKSHDALSAEVVFPYPALEVVFVGDSITEGSGLASGAQNACDVCAHDLALGAKPRQIFYSNQGHSGHTTKDYLPGGDDCARAEAAAKQLQAEHPGDLVFSVMLGTNDSANTGPNGSPVSPEQYGKNLQALIKQLMADFPSSKIVLNKAIWYSPNTHNGATYEEEGLERLTTYFPILSSLPRKFPRGKVFLGDTRGYDYFASTYASTQKIENGRNGTFYLHPNPIGAADLGLLWAQAILKAVP